MSSPLTWRIYLKDACLETGENVADLVSTLSEEDLDRPFVCPSRWESSGVPFQAWGPVFTYFPIEYDGRQWVGFVPRNPCNTPAHPQGYDEGGELSYFGDHSRLQAARARAQRESNAKALNSS